MLHPKGYNPYLEAFLTGLSLHLQTELNKNKDGSKRCFYLIIRTNLKLLFYSPDKINDIF